MALGFQQAQDNQFFKNLVDNEAHTFLVYGKGLTSANVKNAFKKIYNSLMSRFDKPFSFEIYADKILIKCIHSKQSWTIYKDCLKDFKVEQDVSDKYYISFEYNNEEFNFVLYRKDCLDVLECLEMNSWLGYLK